MPKPKWTTPLQHEWLSTRIVDFIRAQDQNTVPKFFASVYVEWFNKFPCHEPTATEIQEAQKDVEKAKAIVHKAQKDVSHLSHMKAAQIVDAVIDVPSARLLLVFQPYAKWKLRACEKGYFAAGETSKIAAIPSVLTALL